MVLLGKLHEISFYGVVTTIICLCTGKTTVAALLDAKFDITGFSSGFLAFLFWACVLFVPIAIIGAFATKYVDDGEGLLFKSNSIVVIIFAHIAEEIMGLLLTPFWLLADFFKKRWNDSWKIIDYLTYFLVLIFIVIGVATL